MDFSDNGIRKYLNEATKHLNTTMAANTNTLVFLQGLLTVSTHLLNQWEKVPQVVRNATGASDYGELEKVIGKLGEMVNSDAQ